MCLYVHAVSEYGMCLWCVNVCAVLSTSSESHHRPFLARSHVLHVSEGKVEGGWTVSWKYRWSSQGTELGNTDWL